MEPIYVPIEFFPNQYLDLLKRSAEILSNTIRVVNQYKKDDKYSFVCLECTDYTYVLILGMQIGGMEISDAIRDVLPKVSENIDKMIINATTQSDN